MEVDAQCTSFPNLFDTDEPIQEPSHLTYQWPRPIPRDDLVLSWARLLRAYTGHSDPVFLLQGAAIKVDPSSGVWRNVDTNEREEQRCYGTSLILDQAVERSGFALSLDYDSTDGSVTLSSACRVPRSFLPQIFGQLQQLLCERVNFAGHLVPEYSKTSPSIVNIERKSLPGPRLLHKLVQQHAESCTAIDFLSGTRERRQISYNELHTSASRLSSRLTAVFVGTDFPKARDRIVPILLPQCPELYISQMAVLKSGAAFCPLSVDIPPERLSFVVRDTDAKMMITNSRTLPRLTNMNLGIHFLSVDIEENEELKAGRTQSSNDVKGEDGSLAYVMYTSGSTGLPKGVRVSHFSVTQALLAHDEHVPIYSRFLQFASPTFDVSIFEIFFTFYRAATLVCCERERMLENLSSTLGELQVDAIELTPTVAGTLLRDWTAAPSLKLLLTIGEKLPKSVITRFASDDLRGRTLLPMYGPTEASIHCTVISDITPRAKPGLIGRPLSSVTAFIVSEDQCALPRVLPIGQIGELAIAGQLADGYLNRSEQTQAAFVVLPDYGQIYRTGDRGRLLPNGHLECFGRLSGGQVKIRGQRVELGEIEQVVCKVPEAQIATARVINGNLVAFCAVDKSDDFFEIQQTIKTTCKAWLPSYMRPTDVVLLSGDLPRLPSGKIDVHGLEQEYGKQNLEDETGSRSFSDDLEQRIAKAIGEELDLEIGRSDDLWSKGLDSLRVIRVVSLLRDMGINVAARDILSVNTIAELTERGLINKSDISAKPAPDQQVVMPQEIAEATLAHLNPPHRCEVERIVPCSTMQVAMLSESMIIRHTNFNSIRLEIAKMVTVAKFVEAFCQLVQQNPILRSGFVHLPDLPSSFACVIWKNFDASEQIVHTEEVLDRDNVEQSSDCSSLLRPLSLMISCGESTTTVGISIHHALYDGWSWDLMMCDLNAIIMGHKIPPRIQYLQFVSHEKSFLSSKRAANARDYWKHHLENAEPTRLPTLSDCKRESATRTFSQPIDLSPDILDSRSKGMHVSRQSIPSAAFATLLSLYCGTSDIVFGSVSSGRTLPIPGIESMIGPCIATLPVRINLEASDTVLQLVQRIHQLLRNFHVSGQLPLREIKKVAALEGDEQLFDALFVWQEGAGTASPKSPLSTVSSIDFLQSSLIFEVTPLPETLEVKATYNTAVMDLEQVKRLIHQFGGLTTLFAKSTGSLWRDAVRQIQLRHMSIANPAFSTVGDTMDFTGTVDRLAVEDPNRVAVEFIKDVNQSLDSTDVLKLSYFDLSRRSITLSRFLIRKGIAIDELVCLFMDKSIELYVSILSILRAGAAYMVIDPQAPPDRIRRILDVSKPRLCLTNGSLKDPQVLESFQSVLNVDLIGEQDEKSQLSLEVSGDNLAYAIFTSGSTGLPKGVLITRKNILSNIDTLSRLYPSATGDSLLQSCSPAFDVSVFEILYTWHMGMRLCAASNDVLFRDIEAFIRALHVTHLSLTPSVAALIHPDNVPSVRMLVTAGEAVTPKVFADWAGRGLYQGYGPSETTNICSVQREVAQTDHINNVGLSFPNTSWFVSEPDDFSLLPYGALGEVVVGGDQVGRGYLNDPDLTKQKFFHHHEYGWLYRSGDMGRMLPNGRILFHGRQDDQVKLRGQRVELGEIERALIGLDGVSDSVCLLIQGSERRLDRLVAFWCSRSSLRSDLRSRTMCVFDSLETLLPTYMLPDYLIHVEKLPLTSQGKIDKRALRQIYASIGAAKLNKFARQAGVDAGGALYHPDEIKLAQALSVVTGTPTSEISASTSFFALGLDSISAISFSQQLLSLGFGQVDVSVILRHATIGKLLKILALRNGHKSTTPGASARLTNIFDGAWQEDVGVKYAKRGYKVREILPCTPLQEGMLSQAATGNSAYQNKMVFSISGDLERLKAAWNACVEAYDILRTGFVLTSSPQYPYAQVVLDNIVPSHTKDSTSENSNLHADPFMIPPYTISAQNGGQDPSSRLTLMIHHALYDGHAISLLLRNVERAYNSPQLEPPTPLSAYLKYMVDLSKMDGESFWRQYLNDFTARPLSLTWRSGEAGSSSISVSCHRLSKTPLHRILDSAKRYSVTLLSLLQQTWAQTLSYYSGGRDICFGNVYSGRNLPVPNVEEIIGPCFNTLPVRVILGDLDSNEELLRRLHEHNMAVLPYQPCSLRQIQKHQGVAQLFDTLLLLQSGSIELDPSIWQLEEDSGNINLPVLLEITPDPGSNQLRLKLQTENLTVSEEDAEVVVDTFDSILAHTVNHPQALATDFCMLPDRKTNQLKPHFQKADDEKTNDTFINADKSWSPQEKEVGEILRRVANKAFRHLNKTVTIFQLGLDSINAIQIGAELRKLGYNLTGGDIMEAATVPKIALLCEASKSDRKPNPESFDFDDFNQKHQTKICHRLEIEQNLVEEVRPCTPFQTGILVDFIRSKGEYYLSHLQLEVPSDTVIARLKQSWGHLMARHEVLRTGFAEIDDKGFAFAMVLYQPNSLVVPWAEYNPKFVSGSETSALAFLRRPPWSVCIKENNGQKFMHLTIFHALFDAKTLELLLDELHAIYRQQRLPQVASIKPALSRILQQSSSRDGKVPISLNSISLPVTKFPDLQSHHVKEAGFGVIEKRSAKRLDEYRAKCKKAGVTLQAAGQGAWARLLSAFTGQTANSFGVVLSGRSLGGEEDSVFFPLVNTIPVSVKLDSDTNGVMLQNVASRIAALIQNPYSSLQKDQTDAYDTVFVFQNPSSVATHPWEIITDDAGITNYRLSIELQSSQDDYLDFRLTYQKQAVPLRQARLIIQAFDALLMDSLDHLDEPSFPPTTAQQNLWSISPPKEKEIPTKVKHLHEFVTTSAERHPKKVALEFASAVTGDLVSKTSWTYSELEQRGNLIAHTLQRNGAKVGDFIGFCFDKCPEASFTFLGILKAGCVYVALDPAAPDARKRFILEDAGCKILCTTGDKAENLANLNIDIKILQTGLLAKENSPLKPLFLSRELLSEDICYCLYTSGTTGTPKGCLITHKNAVQFVLAFQRLFAEHWDADSRFLQFASFHFDVSVLEQFWTWSIGACVTSLPRDLLFQDLVGAIRALQITHLDLTPSLAQLLSPEQCPSLCRGAFITGGEQLKQDVIDAWGDRGVIYNGYGPSEVTIGCTMYPRIPQNAKPSNIGPTYDNAGAYVLDPNTKRPVIRGAIGELCISGPLVGKGYLNRPELTAEKFEFLDDLGVRVYHTGDLVRLLHDDTFCFIGRADDQVKLRGQRLEISEINHVVRQASKDVKETLTLVLQHHEGANEQLVTFVALSEIRQSARDISLEIDQSQASIIVQVRRACSANLPAYMMPSHIIPVNIMPISANNKLDGKPLKSLFRSLSATVLQDLSAAGTSTQDFDPRTMHTIVSVLSQLTSIPKTGILPSSRLFELGIDSISTIKLSRDLKSAGYSVVNPSMLMRNPVLADLATELEQTTSVKSEEDMPERKAREAISKFAKRHNAAIKKVVARKGLVIEKIAPCTPLQEGMIAKTLNDQGASYMASFVFVLDPALQKDRLIAAWKQTAAKNEILRTMFAPTSDGYAQVVLKDLPLSQISILRSSDERQEIDELNLRKDHTRWANMASNFNDVPWRVVLDISPSQTSMHLYIFHGLYDGISLDLMLDDVAREYQGTTSGKTETAFHEVLPFGPLQVMTDALDFWTSRLAKIQLLNMPLLNGNRAAAISSSITWSRAQDIRKIRLELGVAEAAMFQACWLMSLLKKFGHIPTIGLVVSGRSLSIEGIEDVRGPLFNTVPCQINLTTRPTLANFVKACHDFNAEVIPHHHTALSEVSKLLGRRASEPLFDSLFVFQKHAPEPIASNGLWQSRHTPLPPPDYALALEVEQLRDGNFTGTIVADHQRLSQHDVEDLHQKLTETIHDLLENPYKLLPYSDKQTRLKGNAGDDEEKALQGVPAKVDLQEVGTHFEWDEPSMSIRAEMSKLAKCSVEEVTPDITIFELGLDSIDAIKLSARLTTRDLSIPVSRILQAGSVVQMAKHVLIINGDDRLQADTATSDFDMVKENLRVDLEQQGMDVNIYEYILPVTPLQESMLANSERYFGQDVLRVADEIDIEKLTNAWQTVIRAHDILRTSFVEVQDTKSTQVYAQLVSPSFDLKWSYSELNHEEDFDGWLAQKKAEAIREGVIQSPIHLTIVTIKKTRYLVLGLFHALYDGWSIDLMHSDVQNCYNSQACDRPSYQPALKHMLEAVSEKSKSFWGNALSGFHPSEFPKQATDSSQVKSSHRYERQSNLPLHDVQDFCRKHGVTLQALGLTCWTLVLSSYLKRQRVCFGVVLAGRDIENADRVMFPTMNTIPFCMQIDGSRLKTLLEVHKVSMAIAEYQHFPLRRAQKLIKGPAQQLFDTLFIYQKRPSSEDQSDPLYESITALSEPEYPVNVEMEIQDEQLVWRTACKNDVLDEMDTTKLVDRLEIVLRSILEESSRPSLEETSSGISICGLPGFDGAWADDSESTNQVNNKALPSQDDGPENHKMMDIIALILAEVAGVQREEILPSTTLFHLGFDSVSAIKVSSALKKRSVSLPVSEMLKSPTIGGMANAAYFLPQSVEKLSNVFKLTKSRDISYFGKVQGLKNIREDLIESILPCSPGQLFFLGQWQASSGRLFYPQIRFRVQGPSADRDTLEEAWNRLVEELSILRTTFIYIPEEQCVMQIVIKSHKIPIVWLANETIPNDTFSTEHFEPPVALTAQSTGNSVLLTLRLHHALYDGVSLPGMIKLFQEFYNQPTTPPSMSIDHRGYHDYIKGLSNKTRQKAFWASYLKDSQPFNFPTPPTNSFSNDRTELYRPKLLNNISPILSSLKSNGISFQALFFAVYALVCSKSPPLKDQNASDLLIGVYLANRSHDFTGLSDLLVPTLNIVPLRIPFARDTSHESLYQAARAVQEDLGRVGDPELSSISLQEVYEWTGVRVERFVNFLKLPETHEDGEGGEGGNKGEEKGVRIENMGFEELAREAGGDSEQKTQTPPSPFFGLPPDQENIRDVFLPSIDIEAAIRDGGLDVGIFGFEDMLDDEQAGNILDGLRDLLGSWSASD